MPKYKGTFIKTRQYFQEVITSSDIITAYNYFVALATANGLTLIRVEYITPVLQPETGATYHNILSSTHTDTTPDSVLRGDLITGQGASPTWERLTLGTTGQYLKSNGTDILWNGISAGDIPAGINANKISAGNVSNTEFDYLDGVSSGIQSQINGKASSTHHTTHATTAGDAFTTSDLLDAIAKIKVRKNGGADVGSRRRLNLIEGANVTLTVADDNTDEEVDVTIASSGGGGAGITKTRTFIPIFPVGCWAKGVAQANYTLINNSTTYLEPYVSTYWGFGAYVNDAMLAQEYDATKYSNISAVYFEAVMGCRTASKTISLELYDITNASDITGSEITHNNQTATRIRSGDIKANMPVASAFISLRLKETTALDGEVVKAQIIIDQSA